VSERPPDLAPLPREPPLIIVLSGPSGAGKDAVRDVLLRWEPRIHRVVTATTRPPRPAERTGHDYYFISEEEFDKVLETGGFAEHAFVYDHRNGVPRIELEDPLLAGRDAIARLDVQGAATIKRHFPDALLIFVAPPSIEESARRLHERHTDTPDEQQRRIETAMREMEAASDFDYIVENETGKLEETARRIIEILIEEKRRRSGG
jgi:guanylate kinase